MVILKFIAFNDLSNLINVVILSSSLFVVTSISYLQSKKKLITACDSITHVLISSIYRDKCYKNIDIHEQQTLKTVGALLFLPS